MIDKNSAIGTFPQIMVRALVIMIVKDVMSDHTPHFYSLLTSFKTRYHNGKTYSRPIDFSLYENPSEYMIWRLPKYEVRLAKWRF